MSHDSYFRGRLIDARSRPLSGTRLWRHANSAVMIALCPASRSPTGARSRRAVPNRAATVRERLIAPFVKGRPMSPLTLARTALLVVDAQQGFTTLRPAELPVPGG